MDMKEDSFNRMSREEYFAQTSSLTDREAREHRELLQGVDLASAESLEDAAAQRAVLEIKRCADQEVKVYLNSDDFKQMVENIKRRERERLLQDIMLEVSKERDAMLAVEREKMKKSIADRHSLNDILIQNQKKIEEQQRKDLEDRQVADAERLREIHRRKELQEEQDRLLAEEASAKSNAAAVEQQLILHRNKKLSFGLKKKSFY